MLRRGVETLVDAFDPFERRESTPLPLRILRIAQHLRVRPTKPLRHEVIERPLDIPQPRPTLSPVKRDLDPRLTPDMHVPATTEIEHRARLSLKRRHRIVFNHPVRRNLSCCWNM